MAEGSVAGLVLAAGTASRLGRPKLVLPLRGRPIIRHVVESALASSLGEIVVVTGAWQREVVDAVREMNRVRIVHNPDYAEGQATSLIAGLRAMGDATAAAAVLLGDQPGIDPATIDRVLQRFAGSELPAARAVHTTAGRRVPGHPVVFDRSFWPLLMSLRGDEGARRLIREREADVLDVPVEGRPPTDVDTDEDYRAALSDAAASNVRRA